MNKILVIGAGSWGTALANLLSKKEILYIYGNLMNKLEMN